MKTDLKVTGTKNYVDVEYAGKKARFWGDLCNNGFAAIPSTMEWVSEEKGSIVTEEEKNDLMMVIKKHFRWKRFKVFFVDDNGNKLSL